jgi:hypothetical protein
MPSSAAAAAKARRRATQTTIWQMAENVSLHSCTISHTAFDLNHLIEPLPRSHLRLCRQLPHFLETAAGQLLTMNKKEDSYAKSPRQHWRARPRIGDRLSHHSRTAASNFGLTSNPQSGGTTSTAPSAVSPQSLYNYAPAEGTRARHRTRHTIGGDRR